MAKFTGHTITSDSALGSAVIQRSLRFNSSDAAHLTRTPSSTGNQKVWTWSAWVKRAKLGANQYLFVSNETNGSGDGIAGLYFGSNDRLKTYYDTSGSHTYGDVNSRKYRDTNAWMNIVWQVDAANTTQRIWINGVEEIGLSNNPIDYNYSMNQSGHTNVIGTSPWNTSSAPSGMYIAEVNHIDGSLIAPTEFGFTDPVTNIWMPKRYEGTYGTNGFNLDFSDNSSTAALGIDKSPNGNDFTANNFSVSAGEGNDSLEDTPTNNYPTLNPLDMGSTTASHLVYSNGNLQVKAASGVWASTRATFAVSSGKWYWEVKLVSASELRPFIGIIQSDVRLASNQTEQSNELGATSTGLAYWGLSYIRGGNNTSGTNTNVPTITTGDIVGVALDMDNKKVFFSKNGTFFASQDPANSTGEIVAFSTTMQSATIAPVIQTYNNTSEAAMNFGQRPFAYTPPTGYKTLQTKNLPPNVPSIVNSQKHFQPLLYTGQNTSSLYNVTGLEFAPDFVWAKARNDSIGHIFIDTVRGDDKQVEGNLNTAEVTRGTPSYRFLKDGFAVSTGGNMNNPVNYVAFCWKAGGAAVSNTDGDITSSVSVNEEAGFSIATYTGTYSSGSNSATTIGHGLGKVPKCAFFKKRSDTGNWMVYHEGLGNTHNLYLNTSDTPQDDAHAFFDTSPTSSLFTFGISGFLNASSQTYVGYFWAEIPGYSKFGTYTGNGSSDGIYVHLGFRPALIIFKSTSASENWQMKNSKQVGYNDQNHSFFCNNENIEYTTAEMDFLSNGFKLRNGGGGSNGSGETFVYMAWAEQPGTTPFDTFPNAR